MLDLHVTSDYVRFSRSLALSILGYYSSPLTSEQSTRALKI